MSNEWKLPADPTIARAMITEQTKRQELELRAGALGWFFGPRSHAPINVVSLVVTILTLFLCVYSFVGHNNGMTTKDMFTLILPVIGTGLGYLYGITRSRRPPA